MNNSDINPYSHFYLYAKGHYIKSDIHSDLKNIMAEFTGIDQSLVKTIDIINVLANVVYHHINKQKFFNLINDLCFGNQWIIDSNKNICDNTINSFLRILRYVNVSDIDGKLDKADPIFYH